MDFSSTVEVKNLVLTQLNLKDDADAALVFDTTWSLYANVGIPELRFLYIKRELLDYLMGIYALKFNSKAYMVSEDEGQVFGHLKDMRSLLDTTMKDLTLYFGSGGAITGYLTTTTPDNYTRMWFGPNSIIYRGLPTYQLPDGNDGTF